MNENVKITSTQLFFMMVGSRIMISYTYLPVLQLPPANQDVWIVIVLSFFYTLLLSIPLVYTANKFRNIPLKDYHEVIMGKFFTKVLFILYAAFFCFLNFRAILVTLVFVNSTILPETSTWLILIFILVPVVFASIMGLNSISRLAYYIVPYVMFTIVLFFSLSIKDMDIRILTPILKESKLLDINNSAFITACLCAELVILPMLTTNLKDNVKIFKVILTSSLCFTILFLLILFPTIMVLGYDLAKTAINPYYLFTRQVQAFSFVQRVESFNLMAWFITVLFKLSLHNYIAANLVSKCFKKVSFKFFAIPFILALCIVSNLPQIGNIYFLKIFIMPYLMPAVKFVFIFVVPSIILLIYFIRRKKIDPKLNELRNQN